MLCEELPALSQPQHGVSGQLMRLTVEVEP